MGAPAGGRPYLTLRHCTSWYDHVIFNNLHYLVVYFQHYQKSLPRLPIPKLEDTCKRYLAALEPILSVTEYKNSEKIVNDFLSGKLQICFLLLVIVVFVF